MPTLSRRGALSVTTDIDRIANVIQAEHETLGIPKEYALKYAYYCDVISDRIERHAIKVAGEEEVVEEEEVSEEKKEAAAHKAEDEGAEEVEVEEDAEKKEASARLAEDEKLLAEMLKEDEAAKKSASRKQASVKKADDETGLSVDHGLSGFDANVIADDVGGPQEILAPIEAWMNSYFAQDWFHELADLQQAGEMSNAAAKGQIITKAASKLQRLAVDSGVSNMGEFIAFLKAAKVPNIKGAGQKRAEEGPKDEEDAEAKEASLRLAEDEELLRQMLAEEDAKSAPEKKDEEAAPEKKEAKSKKAEESKDEEAAPEKKDEEAPKSASTHGYNLFAN